MVEHCKKLIKCLQGCANELTSVEITNLAVFLLSGDKLKLHGRIGAAEMRIEREEDGEFFGRGEEVEFPDSSLGKSVQETAPSSDSDSDSDATITNEWLEGIDSGENGHAPGEPRISTQEYPDGESGAIVSESSGSGDPDTRQDSPPLLWPFCSVDSGTLQPPLDRPGDGEMHQRNEYRLRSVLKKPGQVKKRRSVTFNEALNLFYDSECSCWVHEDEYGREYDRFYRTEREEVFHQPHHLHQQQQLQHHNHHHHHHHHEFEDTPTLSPPEGYKDRFFPQDSPDTHPDVTRVSPPSPPAARRKVFLKEEANGVEEEDEEARKKTTTSSKIGGILKGGRLWRSNSAEGNKVNTPEPDLVKCSEPVHVNNYCGSSSSQTQTTIVDTPSPASSGVTRISTGTTPLRTSEQIRLAVDSTLRMRTKKQKQECSSLVEKLRWLTSLDDEDSSDSNASGFATWPSREKVIGGVVVPGKKSDAGTCTEEFVQSTVRHPNASNEARIKQISYTLEDIDEGLKIETELETFISEDGGRIERLRKRYSEEEDYGFSRRPSVKGIKPKFTSTNQIFAQFTLRNDLPMEAHYENAPMILENNHYGPPGEPYPTLTPIPSPNPATVPQGRPLTVEEVTAAAHSRAHFELIRQSFEPLNRPHSWSVSTLPMHGAAGTMTPPPPQKVPPPQIPMPPNGANMYGTLPGNLNHNMNNQVMSGQQPIYGTVRRVPNVIGRPLFLHYGALSVEAHPNKMSYPAPSGVPETPSPTQQPPLNNYYGPPIRYYNPPPPVPPRTAASLPLSGNGINMSPAGLEVERGVPEGATDNEEPPKEPLHPMNV